MNRIHRIYLIINHLLCFSLGCFIARLYFKQQPLRFMDGFIMILIVINLYLAGMNIGKNKSYEKMKKGD